MKSLQLLFIAIIGFTFSAAAQKGITKSVIKTPTVQCDMCKKKIENYMAHQEGVKSVTVDVKKKTTTVQWINERTNIENIKASIANVGYDADDVSADPDAYKKLPACCKKPAEPAKP
ncbi:MAG: heavy metal-associated domain-containing protein [Ferruginibacter sp.]